MRKLVLSVAVLAAMTLGISTAARADHWQTPSHHHSSCRPTPPPWSHGGHGHYGYRGPSYGYGGYGGYGNRNYGGYGGYGYGRNPYGYGNGVSVGNGRVSFSIRF